MRGQWLVPVFLLLFSLAVSSPTTKNKTESVTKPYFLAIQDTDDIRELDLFRHRRQVPGFDLANRDGTDGISVQQRQPDESANQVLTPGDPKDVVTTRTSNVDLTTIPNFATILMTTPSIVSDEDSPETLEIYTSPTTFSQHTSLISSIQPMTLSLPLTKREFTLSSNVHQDSKDISKTPSGVSQSSTIFLENSTTLPAITLSISEESELINSTLTSLPANSSNILSRSPSLFQSVYPSSKLHISTISPSSLKPLQSFQTESSLPVSTLSSYVSNHSLSSQNSSFNNIFPNGLKARGASNLENNSIEPNSSTTTKRLKTEFPTQEETTAESVQEEVVTAASTEESTSTIPSTEKNSDTKPLYPFHVADADDLPLHLVEANCDFGEGLNVDLCEWKNVPRTLEKWVPSKGTNFGLLGGPKEDQTNQDDRGGYALFNTKKKEETPFSQSLISDAAMLISPILAKTDGAGVCVDFWYAMEGLSQGKLRILLRPPSPLLFGPVGHEALSDEEFIQKLLSSDGKGDIVLWEHKDSTEGQWINGQIVYALHDRHMLIFEGLPVPDSDPKHAYRGYISLDDIKFMDGSVCKPFCNFEGGFCSWSQDSNDDFDWSIGRGTLNPSTGPIMDNFSLKYSRFGITGGAYAYIDSSYPHRSSHKARLLSEIFSPPSPDAPLCMRFWTHMFGNGIGELRIIVAPTQGEEEVIWHLKGEQGNNWYQGQVTISSLIDFQIVIEAEVGGSDLGDIAIDEIALKEGACPTSPQSASKFKVDCTFEVDECGWRNIEPRLRVDELDWERTLASLARLPNSDHTLKTQSGSFISLPRNSIQRGERGWLVSTPLESPNIPLCLSFWYYLFDPLIETSQPSLGGLMVILMEQEDDGTQTMIPIWRLRNSQGPDWQHGHTSLKSEKSFMILFEGLWGTSKGSEYIALDDITLFTGDCNNKPEKASVSFLDCDFTRDSCSYTNSSSERSVQWIRSSISRRPALLNDHTYGPPPGGYIYFDVFRNNQNSEDPVKVSLTSRVIEAGSDREPFCLTFWYAVSSFDDTTQLTVNRESVDASSNDAEAPPREGSALRIWNVEARKVATNRPEWLLGQTQVSANSDFKISFVGEAKVGGFAIDDIFVYPGTCRTHPTFEDNGFNK